LTSGSVTFRLFAANYVGWRHDTLDGHGAVVATASPRGISMFYGLRSTQATETAAKEMRDRIAAGMTDAAQSYAQKGFRSPMPKPRLRQAGARFLPGLSIKRKSD
jgi:hypothetical protein